MNGLTTGFKSLDKYLEGLKPGQLITIASRPGVGKTSLALNLLTNGCADSNRLMLLFNLEMSAKDVSTRILASTAKVDLRKIRTNDWNSTDQENLPEAVLKISKMPIYINDDAKISFSEVYKICKIKKSEGELGLVVIDYIQLMAGNESELTHRERVTTLFQNLKSMAKELNCPVIVLSQLDNEQRPGTNEKMIIPERPTMRSLRDTSDADVILMLHRDDFNNRESEKPENAEVIIYKNHSGDTGTFNIKWVGSYLSFEEIDRLDKGC